MIFGNHALVHMDGAEYIRVASLGALDAIAEKLGMDRQSRLIMDAAIEELHNNLKESMYKEVKGHIPDVH